MRDMRANLKNSCDRPVLCFNSKGDKLVTFLLQEITRDFFRLPSFNMTLFNYIKPFSKRNVITNDFHCIVSSQTVERNIGILVSKDFNLAC